MVDIVHNQPMTLRAAATYMSVCTKTIREWEKDGLELIRFGKKLYTTRENLQRFGVPRIHPQPVRSTDLERSHQEAMRLLSEQHGSK